MQAFFFLLERLGRFTVHGSRFWGGWEVHGWRTPVTLPAVNLSAVNLSAVNLSTVNLATSSPL
jgi:hypothetical protein